MLATVKHISLNMYAFIPQLPGTSKSLSKWTTKFLIINHTVCILIGITMSEKAENITVART